MTREENLQRLVKILRIYQDSDDWMEREFMRFLYIRLQTTMDLARARDDFKANLQGKYNLYLPNTTQNIEKYFDKVANA